MSLVQDLRGESSTADLPEALLDGDARRRRGPTTRERLSPRTTGSTASRKRAAAVRIPITAPGSWLEDTLSPRRARSPRHGGGGGIERGDRRSPCDRRCDGAIPREAHPAQAGCQKPHRGGRALLAPVAGASGGSVMRSSPGSHLRSARTRHDRGLGSRSPSGPEPSLADPQRSASRSLQPDPRRRRRRIGPRAWAMSTTWPRWVTSISPSATSSAAARGPCP